MVNFATDELQAAIRTAEQSADPAKMIRQNYFPSFSQHFIQTSGTTIHTLVGGQGKPLLLLHGHPETYLAWRKIAGRLAKRFTVVLTDLRGYGDSGKPDGGVQHINYSKRAMGRDQFEVMHQLGFDRFQAAGHDRGGRVLAQMLLDHGEAIERAALLDIAPTTTMYQQTDRQFATRYFWWFFHIQAAPLPEKMIERTADLYLIDHLAKQCQTDGAIEPDVIADYLRCFRNPACIHAICEDYRASATIDEQIEEETGNVKSETPLLVLWGAQGTVGRRFDVIAAWKEFAAHVQGAALPGGHSIPEEAPAELLAAFGNFFRS